MQAQHRALAARHLLLVEGVHHEGERAAVRARGGLDHVRDVALARRRIDVVELLARKLGVTAEVEIRSIGDALQLRPAHREQVLDVARPGRVMGQLVGPVRAQLQVVGPDAQVGVPAHAIVHPALVPLLRLGGRHEELDLHLLELPRAEDEVAGRDLVAERLADLGDAERRLARANWSTFLKFTKMPCAVSGRRKMRAASSAPGP